MALPKYRSHKVVEAFKIKEIVAVYEVIPVVDVGGAHPEETMPEPAILPPPPRVICATLIPEAYGLTPVRVDVTYLRRHDPQVGGYYVRYPDGYESWSPAEAFEEGYTRLIG